MVPGEVAEEVVEPAGGAEGVDDPVVAVAVDDGLVEIEHHKGGAVAGAVAVGRRHLIVESEQRRKTMQSRD